jgi:MFS transporter, DHA1 family, multidrug resistance protein
MLAGEGEKPSVNGAAVDRSNRSAEPDAVDKEIEAPLQEDSRTSSGEDVEEAEDDSSANAIKLQRTLTRTSTIPYTPERFDVEQAIEAHRTKSIVLAPTKTSDGTILVDWYTTDDPANPQNWRPAIKGFALAILCFYTFAAYGASSMYVSGVEGVMKEFHVGPTPGALGLAIYVVGYGVGPVRPYSDESSRAMC